MATSFANVPLFDFDHSFGSCCSIWNYYLYHYFSCSWRPVSFGRNSKSFCCLSIWSCFCSGGHHYRHYLNHPSWEAFWSPLLGLIPRRFLHRAQRQNCPSTCRFEWINRRPCLGLSHFPIHFNRLSYYQLIYCLSCCQFSCRRFPGTSSF